MSDNNKHFGYWVFGKDLLNVSLESLKSNGVTDIFVNYYAFQTHGESKVKSWIKQAKTNFNVHIWVQCFYDGSWHNPKTYNLSNKRKEIQKYSKIDGVSGIHLDYLRYPGNAYKTDGSADAITNFVKTVRKENPNVVLSCAVMPEDSSKYYYGQDIAALGKIVDIILPMQYKGNYKAGTSWLASTTKSLSKKAVIWSGLQTYKSDDNPTKLTTDELLTDIQTCLNNGANGAVLFRYGLSPNVNFNKFTSSNNKVTKTIIKKLSISLKEYIEKNHKIPSSISVNGVKYSIGQVIYILSYKVNNITKNSVEVFSVKTASNSSGDSINETLSRIDYVDCSKRLYNYILSNKQLPNYVVTKKSGKKMSLLVYSYMLAKIVAWFYNNGEILPNNVSLNSKSI